jgi:hypothetical protein
MLAVRQGHSVIVQELLAKGADACLKNRQGQTASMIAQEIQASSLAAQLEAACKRRGQSARF